MVLCSLHVRLGKSPEFHSTLISTCQIIALHYKTVFAHNLNLDPIKILLLLLLVIWQSPGLPGWRKVNFITVTRRPLHPSIAAGFYCLTTTPGFLPALCEKWSGFFYVHRVWLSYTWDRRLKVSSESLGNEEKAPCPRALLPGRGSNWGPPVWKSEVLTARPRQLLKIWKIYNLNFIITLTKH